MKDSFDLVIDQEGNIEGIYQDDLAAALGAEIKEVKRASHVEWEKAGGWEGWTVRSALDPEIAIRLVIKDGAFQQVVGREGDIAVFTTREAALEAEVRFFWEIVGQKPPRELVCPRCHTQFADPDPKKEFPAGIICPECSRRNKESGVSGLVGVIHPQ